jgi:tetratricopeptide (TPR) repeat protein
VANTISPFWNRLPKFFVYPFHPRPLLLMIVLAIATVLFTKANVFTMLIRFAIWGVMLKYSYAALKSTAHGSLSPPKISAETISDDFGVVFKQIGIYIAVGVAFGLVAASVGPILGLLFLLFAILSLPAMIIVLVATSSLLHALNPMVFARMAWRIGWGYLLMYLFLGFLGSAPAFLGRYIIVYLPAGTHLFLWTMAQSFYTLISYHLMGYVIFQYHEEIGYEVDIDEEVLSSSGVPGERDADNELLNRVDIFIKEGRIDEAISLIRDETGGSISDLGLAERYYNLLKVKQQTPEMLKHGKSYLDLLAEAGQKDRLCEVYSECVSRDAGFTTSPSTLLKVASSVNESGNPRGAIEAYKRFIKTHPKNPLIPKAYFLAANIVNEKLKNPQKAAGILKGILKSFPNHEIVPYVERYLRQIIVP